MDVTSINSNSVPLNVKIGVAHNREVGRVNQLSSLDYDIPKLAKEDVDKLVGALNKEMKPTANNINFGYSEDLNQLIIEVKDNNTGEVIKQMPSEEALKLAKKVKELVGIMFDTKA